MAYKIRSFFLQIVKNIMSRLQNAAATLLYFFAKLKAIFEKFYARTFVTFLAEFPFLFPFISY